LRLKKAVGHRVHFFALDYIRFMNSHKKSLVRVGLAALLIFTVGLSACVQDIGEEVPKTPSNPGNQPAETVAGTDSDGDGLRDDVQQHILNSYPAGDTRSAAIQLAKAFQSLLVNGTNKAAALSAANAMNAGIDCLFALDSIHFAGHVEGIEGAVVNTGSRARAYARAGAFLSGGHYSVSVLADNASSCVGNP
jgi:hypothetical protein